MALFTTTIDSPNRLRDQVSVKRHINLEEKGNSDTKLFWSKGDCDKMLAKGYNRIVYGDHGPYVELDQEHVCFENFPKSKTKTRFA